MLSEGMSEVREDLGYLPKGIKEAWHPLRIPMSPIPNHKHEDDAVRANRKARALSAIRKTSPDIEELNDGSVKMNIKGFEYILWPSSDVYLMSWRDKYEVGIEKLCSAIQQRLQTL